MAQLVLVTGTVALMTAIGVVFLVTRLQAPIVEMVSLATGLLVLVTGIVTLVIKPLALVTRKVSRP